MAGIAVDNLLHAATRRASTDGSAAANCLARFVVTKHSWRGKYRRVLCVTPTSLFTQHPENLQVTNVWSFVDDPDIDGVVVPPESEGEHELVLSCRNDKKVRCTLATVYLRRHVASMHRASSSHSSSHASTEQRFYPFSTSCSALQQCGGPRPQLRASWGAYLYRGHIYTCTTFCA